MKRLAQASVVFVFALSAASMSAAATWKPLFNGKNLDGFYVFALGKGIVPLERQTAFKVEDGMIHVAKTDSAHLITSKDYSWYRLRLDYRFAKDAGSENAGLVIHVNKAQAFSGKLGPQDNRPESIEVNMKRAGDMPWSLASWYKRGPYMTTTVKRGTIQYLPKDKGGVEWTNDPWCADPASVDPAGSRQILSSLPNPEKPLGEWNHGEVVIHGDSGEFFLNGQLRNAAWNFRSRQNPESPSPRVPYDHGGIGLQSEGHEIWYRNIEIMELEPGASAGAPAAPAH